MKVHVGCSLSSYSESSSEDHGKQSEDDDLRRVQLIAEATLAYVWLASNS